MAVFRAFLLKFCVIFVAFSFSGQGLEILVRTVEGHNFVLDIAAEDTVYDLKEHIKHFLDVPVEQQRLLMQGKVLEDREILAHHYPKELWLDFIVSDWELEAAVSKAATSVPRNYHAAVTPEEKKDISYIVKTLADTPTIKLLKHKAALDYAGARVNHVHPLRFLMTIFTDEELKVAIRNIKRKGGWVWGEFMKGLAGSLEEESGRNNMRDAFVEDFAKSVEINTILVFPSTRSRGWHDLVDVLITHVPRKGGGDRYDM